MGATQIVVTALLTPEIAAALLRLYDLGKNIIVISVDREPPDITNLPFPVYHVPPLESYWTGGYWDANGKPVDPVVLRELASSVPPLRTVRDIAGPLTFTPPPAILPLTAKVPLLTVVVP